MVRATGIFKSFQVDSSIEVMLRKIVLEHCCQLEFSPMIKMFYRVSTPYSWMQKLWVGRTDSTMPFYKRDLSIHRFWYPWGILEPIPHGHQGLGATENKEPGSLITVEPGPSIQT